MTIKNLALTAALVFGASQASAATVFGDLNTTLTENGSFQQTPFDINGDGLNDINAGFFSSGSAFVSGLTDFTPIDNGNNIPGGVTPVFGGSFTANVSQTTLVSDGQGEARIFQLGELVDGSNGYEFGTAYLYGNTNLFNGANLLPNVGDAGFLGMRIQTGEGTMDTGDGTFFTGFTGDVTSTFAFVSVEHGSIILGGTGYNTVAGQGLVVAAPNMAAVPLPASVLLLGGALGGLGAMRRRKKA